MGKTSSAVKNRYNAKAYDQLPVRVPKGRKATVEELAKELETMDVRISQHDEWVFLLVNEEKTSVLSVLGRIQEKHKIKDMQLEEISTEDVIKKIYQEGI